LLQASSAAVSAAPLSPGAESLTTVRQTCLRAALIAAVSPVPARSQSLLSVAVSSAVSVEPYLATVALQSCAVKEGLAGETVELEVVLVALLEEVLVALLDVLVALLEVLVALLDVLVALLEVLALEVLALLELFGVFTVADVDDEVVVELPPPPQAATSTAQTMSPINDRCGVRIIEYTLGV